MRFGYGNLGLGRKLHRRFMEIWLETGVGLGWVVEARVWVGVFSSPIRECQSKRLKLFYIISCFVCLIRCFKKTTFSIFNLLIGYLLLIR